MKKGMLAKTMSVLLAACMSVQMGVNVAFAEPTPAEGTVITVPAPGAGEDASPAIQAAIEQAKTVGGPVTIAFEKDRQYDVFPETSYHETGYYISNAATKGENANGERWSAIFLKDMNDITIEGNNAMLMIHGVMTPILVDHSENITFQNLHVDWFRPTMSEFTIKEVGDTYAKVQVNPSSLYKIENGRTLRWLSEEKPDGGYYWTLTGGLTVQHNPVNNTSWRSGFSYPSSIVDEGDNVLKFEYGSRPGLTVGQTYQFRSGSRDQVGSFIHRSKDVHFENMGFHYMHGLGIVGQYTENLSFNNLDCTPRPETGRTCASSADFVQISGCKGLVSITNSKFHGAHDDIINIHGTHLIVTNKDDAAKKITVQFRETRSWGFQAFQEGDEIEFINSNSMIPYGSNKVKNFRRIDDFSIELELEDPLPDGIRVGNDAVENITWTPDVLVKGNYASGIPTRGILCTTRGKVLIEDNYFYRTQMSGILLEDDARGWYESGLIRDMTIRNNTFDNCGGPVIHSNPQTNVSDPNQTVHSNITIEGNTFKGNVNINARSTANLVVSGNTFENGGSVSLSACNGFTITDDNVGLGSVSAGNSVGDRSLASFAIESEANTETLDRAGMAATAVNERSGYTAQNVLDGNASSIWHTDWENPPAEASITVNLNGAKTFNRVAVLPRQNGETTAMITGYELLVKEAADGEFVKVVEGTWPATAAEKYIDLEQAVTAVEAKLVVTDAVKDTSNRLVASAAEINFQNAEKLGDTVAINKKFKLGMKAVGKSGMTADLSGAEITYESLNPEIVEAAEDGILTAKAAGKATIKVTVTAYGKTLSDTVTVTVTDDVYQTAESITLDAPGASGQMTAAVEPAEAAGDLAWKVETLSGEKASISESGLITAPGAARLLVTAYSQNDSAVSDSMMLTVTPADGASSDWAWVNENKANWTLTDEDFLSITLEPGAIWSDTTNTVKNVLTKPVAEEDFELVAKMDYKPEANYADAGILMYSDLDNYVMLSRKKHPGYGGQIFSFVTEVGGSPWESPSEKRVMDPIASTAVYLKMTKVDGTYSGYYSENGTVWTPVYENRAIAMTAAPKIGVIGYVPNGSSDGAAIFEYLEVNGEKITFGSLNPAMQYAQAEISEITLDAPLPADVELPVGGDLSGVVFPQQAEIVWNGVYTEQAKIEWDDSAFDGSVEGEYTITGRMADVDESLYPEGFVLSVKVTVGEPESDVDKSFLEALVASFEDYDENRYTTESWDELKAALDAAQVVLDDKQAIQDDVYSAYLALVEARDSLEYAPDKSLLKLAMELAQELLENDKVELTPESIETLNAAIQVAQTVLDDPEATQDQINAAYDDVMMAMIESVDQIEIARENLKNLIDAVEGLKNSYKPITWEPVEQAMDDARVLLEKEDATLEELKGALNTLLSALTGAELRADMTSLQLAYDTASAIAGDPAYDAAGLTELLGLAEEMLADPNADQEDVDALAAELARATAQVRLAKVIEAGKNKLNEIDETAFTAESVAALKAALDNAQHLAESGLYEEQIVKAAETQMETALANLKPVEKPEPDKKPSKGSVSKTSENDYWDGVIEKIENASEGDTINVKLEDGAMMPATVLDRAKAKGVKLNVTVKDQDYLITEIKTDAAAVYYSAAELTAMAGEKPAKPETTPVSGSQAETANPETGGEIPAAVAPTAPEAAAPVEPVAPETPAVIEPAAPAVVQAPATQAEAGMPVWAIVVAAIAAVAAAGGAVLLVRKQRK